MFDPNEMVTIAEQARTFWETESFGNLMSVVLGWALGISGTLLIEWRSRRRRVGGTQAAISRELRELAYRMSWIVYNVESKMGRLDKEFLGWMEQQVARYEGPNSTPEAIQSFQRLRQASEEELEQLNLQLRATRPGSFYPREEASYSTSAAAHIHGFAPDYSHRLLDILSNLRMFNETRENQIYFFRLTFASGITDDNWEKARENVDGAVLQMGQRARIIVDKITAFEKSI